MDSTAFKYNHHYRQQNQHFARRNNNNNSNNNNSIITSHNHKNQNSIFILNTAANSILPNNPEFYYSDSNDNNVVSLSSSSSAPSTTATAPSSVWSSASSTMCSPAAHAIQKLFNCSTSSFKLNYGNYRGIESKTFKSKSEILKKKSKFWKYLEGEANDKNHQRGIENDEKMPTKSFQCKSKYWSKSYESDNQNQQDLSKLLEYSCSLCDNCRCMDCQIGYFDCENSDDSNSEYSFHLSAYEEEDEDADADASDNESFAEREMELKTSRDAHNCLQVSYESCCSGVRKLSMDSKLPSNCNMTYCVCSERNCSNAECCQQCFVEGGGIGVVKNLQEIVTPQHH